MPVLQAEKDHHVRDTYNYVTIQTDIKMPQRAAAAARDTARQVSRLLMSRRIYASRSLSPIAQ